jgi:hypothetical protein
MALALLLVTELEQGRSTRTLRNLAVNRIRRGVFMKRAFYATVFSIIGLTVASPVFAACDQVVVTEVMVNKNGNIGARTRSATNGSVLWYTAYSNRVTVESRNQFLSILLAAKLSENRVYMCEDEATPSGANHANGKAMSGVFLNT